MAVRVNEWSRKLAGATAVAALTSGATVSIGAATAWGATTGGAPAPFDVGVAVNHLPTVAAWVTDNLDETALYRRALVLSAVGRHRATLQAEIDATARRLHADAVAALLDDQAAAASAHDAADAAAAEQVATSQAAALQESLQRAAMRLYVASGVGQSVSVHLPSSGNAAWTQDLLRTAQREKSDVAARLVAARRAHAERRAIDVDAARARAADSGAHRYLAAEDREATRLDVQMTTVAGPNAAAIAADHRALTAQEAADLTSSAALDFVPATPLPAPVATTSTALTWVFAELGRQYLWGGTGPTEFDCSGLMQYAWDKAGVVIPRVAADQDAWTDPVPLSQLLPGDLVFYGTSDIHHVGMYIGDGLMINAPHTGTVVQVSPIWWSDLAGFGRVHAAGTPVASHTLPTVRHPAPKVVKTHRPVPSEPGAPSRTPLRHVPAHAKPVHAGPVHAAPPPAKRPVGRLGHLKALRHHHKHLKQHPQGAPATTTTSPSTTPPPSSVPASAARTSTTTSSTTPITVPSSTTVPPTTDPTVAPTS